MTERRVALSPANGACVRMSENGSVGPVCSLWPLRTTTSAVRKEFRLRHGPTEGERLNTVGMPLPYRGRATTTFEKEFDIEDFFPKRYILSLADLKLYISYNVHTHPEAALGMVLVGTDGAIHAEYFTNLNEQDVRSVSNVIKNVVYSLQIQKIYFIQFTGLDPKRKPWVRSVLTRLVPALNHCGVRVAGHATVRGRIVTITNFEVKEDAVR